MRFCVSKLLSVVDADYFFRNRQSCWIGPPSQRKRRCRPALHSSMRPRVRSFQPYSCLITDRLAGFNAGSPSFPWHCRMPPPRICNSGNTTFPAGTGLIINTHAIHRDSRAYPDPKEFRPERWEGKLQMVTSDEQVGARTDLFSFGAGRRICPGQHIAERNLFYICSHFLWAFDIRKRKDAAGNEIDIDMDDVRPG